MVPPRHTGVEREVLNRITPKKALPKIVEETRQCLQREIETASIRATVVLGGSTAKGTYLAGDHDIDMFVRFDPIHDSSSLSDLLEPVLRRCFKIITRVHGSRDYFHLTKGKFTFEFVPVLRVNSWEEAQNVTDMSPLHVAYVKEKLSTRPFLAGEIRLTKQFCKATKVYGAESYIGGFSGHVIDLLIIYYGGFRSLLQEASAWPARVILDPESRLDDPLTQIQDAKLRSPLVIVDPVQHDRNSAAAVTAEAMALFQKKAREYLRSTGPAQKSFFRPVPLHPKDFATLHPVSRVVLVSLSPLAGKRDVSGAKCAKVYEFLLRECIEKGFHPLESRWEFSERLAILVFVFSNELLSDLIEILGPPIHRTDDVRKFAVTHEIVLSRNDRMVAIEKRAFRDPLKFLKFCCTKPYVLERVKSVNVSEFFTKKPSAKKR